MESRFGWSYRADIQANKRSEIRSRYWGEMGPLVVIISL